MKKILDKVKKKLVSLDIHTYIHTYIHQILSKGGSTRTSFNFHGKRGDWYLVSSRSGDCL